MSGERSATSTRRCGATTATGTVIAVAVRGPSGAPGVSAGTRLSLDGDSVIGVALRDGRPHRVDDYSPLAGSIAERARELGMRSAVGCPVVVGSRTWGR
jgi:GAF domain-containing protein